MVFLAEGLLEAPTGVSELHFGVARGSGGPGIRSEDSEPGEKLASTALVRTIAVPARSEAETGALHE